MSTVACVAAMGLNASCPACISECPIDNAEPRHGYQLCRCPECRLIFSNPMQAANSAWYSSSWLYDLRVSDGIWINRNKHVPWNFAQALSRMQPGDRRLLDVGCAEGQFLHLAKASGIDVTGLDFNPASLRIAREVFGLSSVYQSSAEEFYEQHPDLHFDVVTMFEVLEHTTDPFQILCSLRNLLKTGGRLMLSVPGNARWPAFFHPEVDAPPHHLTLWTDSALRMILERAGFRVLSICSKPLGADDIGIHLKWRLHRALKSLNKQNHAIQRRDDAQHSNDGIQRFSKKRMLMREVGRATLAPLCWGLRLHPRAGGFTLFAECTTAAEPAHLTRQI